jgi:hypothetical protein
VITLICGACHSPITGDTGALAVYFADIHAHRAAARAWREAHPQPMPASAADAYPEPIRWEPVHDACVQLERGDAYDIGAAQLATKTGFIRWSAHLSRKNWIGATDWEAVLREAAGEVPSQRIRISERQVS